MRPVKILLIAFVAIALLAGCRRTTATPDRWDLTPEQIDSLTFERVHHYGPGYNFKVTADSLTLQPAPVGQEGEGDTVCVEQGDHVVVAGVDRPDVGPDSVWIKVARDQTTIGWLPERVLLQGAVPDDPISVFIRFFSQRNVFLVVVLLVAAAALALLRSARRKRNHMVHFNDIASPYPTLLCLVVSAAAVLYSSIQMFRPEAWQEFYFHPTLNPFGCGLLLGTFITAVWLILLLALAATDDVLHRLEPGAAAAYLLWLFGFVLVLYLVFTLTTRLYVGFALLPLYAAFAVVRYRRHRPWPYTCGRCGRPLRHKGRCPHCGALNV